MLILILGPIESCISIFSTTLSLESPSFQGAIWNISLRGAQRSSKWLQASGSIDRWTCSHDGDKRLRKVSIFLLPTCVTWRLSYLSPMPLVLVQARFQERFSRSTAEIILFARSFLVTRGWTFSSAEGSQLSFRRSTSDVFAVHVTR